MSGALQVVFQNQRSFAPPLDAQFNYVTMLLHGDGTNGAQNNTFLDSSTNNFTITRNGNTTQGSFSPYGSNWSNFFDGTGDYLNTATNSAFAMGTGDFTAELWVYQTSVPGLSMQMLDTRNGGLNGIILAVNTSRVPYFYSGGTDISSSTALTLNTWNHIAGVRSGSTMTLYLNGVNVASTSSTDNLTGNNCYIGQSYDLYQATVGYLSNVRLVKGTAVYTSAFTPPTTPLTAISGTSLLTCQSNRFKDNSTNNFTLTVTGNTSVQRFNPFGASTAYSTSVIGGSGYFDGAGDYLTVTQQTYSSNFTIECWFYQTAASENYPILFASSNTDVQIMVDYQGNGKLTFYSQGSSIQSASGVFQRNQWNHLAYVRSGTTVTIYYNGTSVASGTRDDPVRIRYLCGFDTDSYVLNGYTSDVRITTSAVYTTTFTPPTAPLTAISGTSILLNMTNGAIYDNAMMNDLETVGNAQISTSVKKYGTGSLAFDGTNDFLNSTNSLLAIQGSRAFTLEAWIYPTSVAGDLCIYETRGGTGFVFFINAGGKLQVFDSVAGMQTQSTTTLIANTWTFISLVRVAGSSTVTYYVNGTSAGTFSLASFATATRTRIGAREDAIAAYVGYIDDFRITIGYARYTADFTPPISAFPDIGPT